MMKRNISIFSGLLTALVLLLALPACNSKSDKDEAKNYEVSMQSARDLVAAADAPRAITMLDSLIIGHQSELSLDDLCEVVSMYVSVAGMDGNTADECMLKGATVMSYAKKINPDLTEAKIDALKPGARSSLERLLFFNDESDSTDVFVVQSKLHQ